MNVAETYDLLRLAQTYDNRKFDDATVLAWHEIFADLPAEDCRTAVVHHFATSDRYLMPVHICRGAEEIDRDRRRQRREAIEAAERLAIEADPTRKERTAETYALIAELRASLPDTTAEILRRPEVVEWEKQRERLARAEPNPLYDPAIAVEVAP